MSTAQEIEEFVQAIASEAEDRDLSYVQNLVRTYLNTSFLISRYDPEMGEEILVLVHEHFYGDLPYEEYVKRLEPLLTELTLSFEYQAGMKPRS